MTTDEIIKLAREADPFGEHGRLYQVAALTPETLIRFCHIIRNEALEEAARVCIETGSTKGSCDAAFDTADACAAAIRAMKEQP